jgi:hypothetical protein
MQFLLTINLDGAEVAEAGIDRAVPDYLLQVIRGVETGNDYPGAWRVRDGNGNTVGQYVITEDEGG